MFLKNKNIIFKIRRSKVTDYAALSANQTHLNALTNDITALLSQLSLSGSYQLDLTWWHVCSKAQTVLK